MNDAELESQLASQRWRKPSPQFLQRVLDTALAERASSGLAETSSAELDASVSSPRRNRRAWPLWLGIPRPLRLPLAACWLLALFFRLTTPDSTPAHVREAVARMPEVPVEVILANAKEHEATLRELLAALESKPERRAILIEPTTSPLP